MLVETTHGTAHALATFDLFVVRRRRGTRENPKNSDYLEGRCRRTFHILESEGERNCEDG